MSNMTQAAERMFARAETYAFSVARGKDAASDMAMDLFDTARTDETVGPDMARSFYIAMRTRAEVIALDGGKALKAQTDKSRNAQVSKLASFATIGEVARDNPHVAPALAYAKRLSEGGYVKLVACSVAVKKALLIDRNADEDTLRMAIDGALEAGDPETASQAVGKVLASWEKLVKGKGDEPSVHEPMFVRLLAAYPADYAATIARHLEGIKDALKKMEDADKPSLLA